MPAKPIIDIDVVVADPTDEAAYVSALVGDGWESTGTGKGVGKEGREERGAGLQFMLREPEWHEHRFFVYDEEEPVANVHVFGPGCPELVRHQIFKEWLLAVSALSSTSTSVSQCLLSDGHRWKVILKRESNANPWTWSEAQTNATTLSIAESTQS